MTRPSRIASVLAFATAAAAACTAPKVGNQQVGEWCASDEECEPTAACVDNECVPRCDDDADCAPTQICDGVCVPDPQCSGRVPNLDQDGDGQPDDPDREINLPTLLAEQAWGGFAGFVHNVFGANLANIPLFANFVVPDLGQFLGQGTLRISIPESEVLCKALLEVGYPAIGAANVSINYNLPRWPYMIPAVPGAPEQGGNRCTAQYHADGELGAEVNLCGIAPSLDTRASLHVKRRQCEVCDAETGLVECGPTKCWHIRGLLGAGIGLALKPVLANPGNSIFGAEVGAELKASTPMWVAVDGQVPGYVIGPLIGEGTIASDQCDTNIALEAGIGQKLHGAIYAAVTFLAFQLRLEGYASVEGDVWVQARLNPVGATAAMSPIAPLESACVNAQFTPTVGAVLKAKIPIGGPVVGWFKDLARFECNGKFNLFQGCDALDPTRQRKCFDCSFSWPAWNQLIADLNNPNTIPGMLKMLAQNPALANLVPGFGLAAAQIDAFATWSVDPQVQMAAYEAFATFANHALDAFGTLLDILLTEVSVTLDLGIFGSYHIVSFTPWQLIQGGMAAIEALWFLPSVPGVSNLIDLARGAVLGAFGGALGGLAFDDAIFTNLRNSLQAIQAFDLAALRDNLRSYRLPLRNDVKNLIRGLLPGGVHVFFPGDALTCANPEGLAQPPDWPAALVPIEWRTSPAPGHLDMATGAVEGGTDACEEKYRGTMACSADGGEIVQCIRVDGDWRWVAFESCEGGCSYTSGNLHCTGKSGKSYSSEIYTNSAPHCGDSGTANCYQVPSFRGGWPYLHTLDWQ